MTTRAAVHLPAITTAWLLATSIVASGEEKRLADRQGTLWYPAVEWSIEAAVPSGLNPFDVEASATFVHAESGEELTTGLFYDGEGTWKLRFTGPKTGTWRVTTNSGQENLDAYQGTVEIAPNPEPFARGFVSHAGNQWTWSDSGDAFVPQLVMYKNPDEYLDDAEQIDADIRQWMHEHGFNGFHTVVLTRWFDINRDSSDQFDTDDPNPDPRTFEALELLITKTYEAGGMVHIWAWGDESRRQTPNRWGINGAADRRLQRYIAARLGPLPGWTMGYGFDLWEWVTGEELATWHTHMHRHLAWPHLLGARAHKNELTQLAENLDYASYEQHRPAYDRYRQTVQARPDRPAFSEDRFRVRENSRYPEKDYTPEMTRRGLWHSTMAGGVANIWGYLVPGAKDGYPNREQTRTYARFFDGRFLRGMRPCNQRTDYEPGVTLDEGDLCVCLGDPATARYIFYAENTDQIRMDLRDLRSAQSAIAVDVLKPYREIELDPIEAGEHRWRAPYRSAWAIAVGRFPARAREGG